VTITPERLDSMFRPRSVALIGAADKSMFSAGAYRNLVNFGMAGRVHLVNRRGVEVHGRPSLTSCQAIGEPVDVALMMVPQAATIGAMEDAAEAGIKNVIVLSSGYGEAGEDGKQAEADLVAAAERLGMLILGPNMLGFANYSARTAVTAVPVTPGTGDGAVALLSQSGASSSAMVDYAGASGADLSFMVTLGNEAMITAGHILDYLVDDPGTKAVAIFLETIRDPEAFARGARRAAAAGKAVVALKAGSSDLAARTARAHTGALVGDDRVTDAVLRELGVIRVDSIEDMLVTAGTAASVGRLPRRGTSAVSISGGACDILADRAADEGLDIPAFAPETTEKLAGVMPGYGTVHNPLDVTGAAIIDPTIWTRAIEAAGNDPSVGSVLMINGIPTEDSPTATLQRPTYAAIAAGAERSAVPVIWVSQVQQPVTAYTRELLAEYGNPPVIPGLVQAVKTVSHLGWWSQAVDQAAKGPADVALPAPAHDAPRSGQWSEHQARELLASASVSVIGSELVTSADDAAAAAGRLSPGGPVALKIVSPQILHKSDIGGVALGVTGADAVRAAYEKVTAAGGSVEGAEVEGVLVSPMRSGGLELLVGVVRDPQWGPVLAVGLGGVLVEVLKDSALATLPVTPARVTGMLRSLRGAALLDGVRGTAPANGAKLSEEIARIGNLALALGDDLESLEVNPLRVDGDIVEALDAVIEWRTR